MATLESVTEEETSAVVEADVRSELPIPFEDCNEKVTEDSISLVVGTAIAVAVKERLVLSVEDAAVDVVKTDWAVIELVELEEVTLSNFIAPGKLFVSTGRVVL